MKNEGYQQLDESIIGATKRKSSLPDLEEAIRQAIIGLKSASPQFVPEKEKRFSLSERGYEYDSLLHSTPGVRLSRNQRYERSDSSVIREYFVENTHNGTVTQFGVKESRPKHIGPVD
ncbi:hypothetical protein KA107_01955 [Candidatus Pacearchaeota archaeon]|nr:hypothetical protein [Candidatus Pacearchaeota archaeon]